MKSSPSLLVWLSIGFKYDRIGKTNLLKFCEDIYIILKEFWFSTSTQCQFFSVRVKSFPFSENHFLLNIYERDDKIGREDENGGKLMTSDKQKTGLNR